MEFTDSSIQHVGLLKQEHVATQSCASSAWGEQDAKPTGNKRRVSTGKTYVHIFYVSTNF